MVIIIDICTAVNTADVFTWMMQNAGADVRMKLFLGKTKKYKNITLNLI